MFVLKQLHALLHSKTTRLVTAAALVTAGVIAFSPGDAMAVARGEVSTQHIVTCTTFPTTPYLSAGRGVVGTGYWNCTPGAPDVLLNCVHIEIFLSGSGWLPGVETCSSEAKAAGGNDATTECVSGRWSYRTVQHLTQFHGNWSDYTDIGATATISC